MDHLEVSQEEPTDRHPAIKGLEARATLLRLGYRHILMYNNGMFYAMDENEQVVTKSYLYRVDFDGQ